jgi:hypothetical protein
MLLTFKGDRKMKDCKSCQRMRKYLDACEYMDKVNDTKSRQRFAPVDNNGGFIFIGDKIEFMTLYGTKTAIVNRLSSTRKGWIAHFEPQQIGPHEAFKPVSSWAISHLMQHCYLSA